MAKILIADDHPHVVRLIEVALDGAEHTVSCAYNGRDALALAESEHPHVLILDITMPELDGIRVLSRIKTDPTLRDICVVMLTAHDDPQDITLGLDVGADFYLSKPFKPAEVAALVERVLRIREAEPA